ncbi:MAG: hypothetical protein JXR52_02300 [Bacteroidales bacterium]|nr:hypothetical protein [Bacteroidales bacterium]MBN2697632.1 hypothetical protein [Bacteroidales bacterium]
MKRRFIGFSSGFALMTIFITGCEFLEDCGTCEYVKYRDGVEVTRGSPTPFCGDDYYEKLNDPGRYIDDTWAIWECD